MRYQFETTIQRALWAPSGWARWLVSGLTLILVLMAGIARPAAAAVASDSVVRVGLTATFPNEQYRGIEDWRLYLEQKLQRRVEFVRRESYLEMAELLRLKKLDFAWICDYPFVHFSDRARLLVVPLFQKRPYYRSYLIVPATDASTTSIRQLKSKMFAYSDPFSNTGYLTPRFELRQIGEDPARFFSQTFFTWSHRKAIEAVANHVADGAAVSSHVWETLAIVKPELTSATRVVWKSREYGFAPFVAHPSVPAASVQAMRDALIGMASDPEGARLLRGLNLDGFIVGEPGLYDEVRKLVRSVGDK